MARPLPASVRVGGPDNEPIKPIISGATTGATERSPALERVGCYLFFVAAIAATPEKDNAVLAPSMEP